MARKLDAAALLILALVLGMVVAGGCGRGGGGSGDTVNPSTPEEVKYCGGFLDESFGIGGIVTMPLGDASDHVRDVAVQEDGKMVLAGALDNGADLDFALLRYNSDGTLDETFGTDGIITMPVGTSGDLANDLAIQKDGTIVVAGGSEKETASGPDLDVAVVRYK